MTLWNASRADVWCWWLSFSTSWRSLLFRSSFSTLYRSMVPVTTENGQCHKIWVSSYCFKLRPNVGQLHKINKWLKPGLWPLLWSVETLSEWAHLGNSGLSWVWTFWMWLNKLFHLATFSGPSLEDMADQYVWFLYLATTCTAPGTLCFWTVSPIFGWFKIIIIINQIFA